jgi:hypothetical protein
VIQISDGAVQTSGVAVKVIPQGASEASGGGTIGYSADGVVHYLPTQAETNYTSFILIASKSGCIPASKTVVTSANNTAGKVTVQTNDDKNGYALTQSFPSNFAALGINASGHVSRVTLVDTTTTNTDMRGTDNAALAATALSTAVWTSTIAGRIDAAISSRSTYAGGDTSGVTTLLTRIGSTITITGGAVAAVLDSAAILAVADQVWDEATSGHTTAGTYGGRIVRATNSNTEVQITGSNHIAADVHEFQTGVITAGDFAANAITASALATDAVTEIQSGLATAAALAAESTKLNRIEAVATGTVTGAGTSTEVFVGPSATLTITVDSSGNRSAVVVT